MIQEPSTLQQLFITSMSKILELYQCKLELISVDDRFQNCPTRDFCWDPGRTFGHPLPYWDSDQQRWSSIAYREMLGRTNGQRWLQMDSLEDGNEETVFYWHEGTHSPAQFLIDYSPECLSASDEYFRDWAKYFVWCAEEKLDPLGKIDEGAGEDQWINHCIALAFSSMQELESDRLIVAIKAAPLLLPVKNAIAKKLNLADKL